MFTKLVTSTPQSRLAHRAPLQKFTGMAMPSFAKWCSKAIPRWIKREEWNDGVSTHRQCQPHVEVTDGSP